MGLPLIGVKFLLFGCISVISVAAGTGIAVIATHFCGWASIPAFANVTRCKNWPLSFRVAIERMASGVN